MPNHRRTFNEQIAMARGSRTPLGVDHRCSRFWAIRFQCPFHGVEPDEDEDSEEPDQPEKLLQEQLREAETPQIAEVADAVPVVAKRFGDKVFQEKAEVGVGETFIDIPDAPPPPPGRGIPLMVPDENIPEFTPPGMETVLDPVGATSEEALVEFIKAGSRATPIKDLQAVGATAAADNQDEVGVPQLAPAVSGGILAFEALAVSFIAAITATVFAHAARGFNSTLVGSAATFQPPGSFTFGKPNPTQGGFLGGKPPTGGGYHFPSMPGEGDFAPVETQQEFDQRFEVAVKGGGLDID